MSDISRKKERERERKKTVAWPRVIEKSISRPADSLLSIDICVEEQMARTIGAPEIIYLLGVCTGKL